MHIIVDTIKINSSKSLFHHNIYVKQTFIALKYDHCRNKDTAAVYPTWLAQDVLHYHYKILIKLLYHYKDINYV